MSRATGTRDIIANTRGYDHVVAASISNCVKALRWSPNANLYGKEGTCQSISRKEEFQKQELLGSLLWNFPRSFNILSRNPPHTVAPTLSEPTPELCREPSRNLMQLYFWNLSENCPTGLDCLRPHTILLLANYTTDAIFAFIPKLQSHLGVFFCV